MSLSGKIRQYLHYKRERLIGFVGGVSLMVLDEIVSPQESMTNFHYCVPYGFTLYMTKDYCPSGQIVWEWLFGIISVLILVAWYKKEKEKKMGARLVTTDGNGNAYVPLPKIPKFIMVKNNFASSIIVQINDQTYVIDAGNYRQWFSTDLNPEHWLGYFLINGGTPNSSLEVYYE
jgi:hypothetical protein